MNPSLIKTCIALTEQCISAELDLNMFRSFLNKIGNKKIWNFKEIKQDQIQNGGGSVKRKNIMAVLVHFCEFKENQKDVVLLIVFLCNYFFTRLSIRATSTVWCPGVCVRIDALYMNG